MNSDGKRFIVDAVITESDFATDEVCVVIDTKNLDLESKLLPFMYNTDMPGIVMLWKSDIIFGNCVTCHKERTFRIPIDAGDMVLAKYVCNRLNELDERSEDMSEFLKLVINENSHVSEWLKSHVDEYGAETRYGV
jgi:hypothetical protein